MNYFDSHAHLCHEHLYADIDAILSRAQEQGIIHILNICTNLDTLQKGLALQAKYPWIFTAAATTPHDVAEEGELVFPIIAQHAKKGSLKAIGETGLDYHRYQGTAEIQHYFLKKYLLLALECHLPIVIHCRDAFADFFKILDENYIVNRKHAPGVLHCFTGTFSEAQAVIERGWYLSFSGIVTFKNSRELQDIAKWVPLDQLLVETDSPYLAPQTKRGKLNEPGNVPEIVSLIASLKGLSVESVAQETVKNACRFLQTPS